MPFSPEKRAGTINGIIFVAIFAAAATMIAGLEAISSLGISPLVIGIVIGIFYANTLHNQIPAAWETGITFSAKKILRFAIVFYGFRITFQQIAEVGMEGFMVSLIMLASTFVIGTWVGQKLFKMDRDTSMLNASGASVCGAAAVLATEPVLKAEEHKAAIAVSMVVLFGTIALFLYPALYSAGVFEMTDREFGIFVGGTVHEVAQVVAIGGAYGQEASDAAVIVKMTRVILIAPMLILLGIYLSYTASRSGGQSGGIQLVIPWFAVYFVAMAGFNSLQIVPANVVDVINEVDTFLLTMAMTALGMGTRFAKFKGLGLAPLYTAGVMFAWLVIGGYFITK
ncbi:MAG: YeiH family protein, partial [Sulfurimonadaceae bacterium]|nr:YeiH family protein [Sulfurimonadaceae bacterium]